MKKHKRKTKKRRGSKRRSSNVARKAVSESSVPLQQEEPTIPKAPLSVPRKVIVRQESHGATIFGKAIQFLRESKAELKKVKWPTRKELFATTAVVLVLTLVIAIFLGVVDIILMGILKNVIR